MNSLEYEFTTLVGNDCPREIFAVLQLFNTLFSNNSSTVRIQRIILIENTIIILCQSFTQITFLPINPN